MRQPIPGRKFKSSTWSAILSSRDRKSRDLKFLSQAVTTTIKSSLVLWHLKLLQIPGSVGMWRAHLSPLDVFGEASLNFNFWDWKCARNSNCHLRLHRMGPQRVLVVERVLNAENFISETNVFVLDGRQFCQFWRVYREQLFRTRTRETETKNWDAKVSKVPTLILLSSGDTEPSPLKEIKHSLRLRLQLQLASRSLCRDDWKSPRFYAKLSCRIIHVFLKQIVSFLCSAPCIT